MNREPMTQNQKFALLIFVIAAGAAVVFVWMTISNDINRML